MEAVSTNGFSVDLAVWIMMGEAGSSCNWSVAQELPFNITIGCFQVILEVGRDAGD